MPEMHDTSMYVPGPWLLTREELLTLDEILEKIWQELEKRHKADVRNATERMFREYATILEGMDEERRKAKKEELKDYAKRTTSREKERTVTFSFRDSQQIVPAETIAAAIQTIEESQALRSRPLRSLTIKMIRAGVKVEMEIPSFTDTVHVYVFPNSLDIANDVFVKLTSWIEARKPSRLVRSLAHPYTALRWAFAGCFVGFLMMFTGRTVPPSPARVEAFKLLAGGGIKPENRDRAMELILSLQSGYTAAPVDASLPTWFWWMSAIVFGLTAIFAYPLETTFRVGGSVKPFDRQKGYLHFLTKWLPFVLVGGTLLKILQTVLAEPVKGWLSYLF